MPENFPENQVFLNMQKYTFITGATSGIGYELALHCALRGHNLILTGRNEPVLKKMAEELTKRFSIAVNPITIDLSELDAPERLWEKANNNDMTVDILINNAGAGIYGPFSNSLWHDQLNMLNVNIIALTRLTRLALPGMISRGEGKILNIASTAGFRPGPLMAVYFASKAFVISFSQALSEELRGSGVTVTSFCPGATRTNFAKTAGLDESQFFKLKKQADPKSVAVAAYNSMMKGQELAVHGLVNRVMVFVLKFIPRRVVLYLSRSVREKK